MKKFFKWVGLILLVMIVVIIIFAFLGKDHMVNLEIQNIDLTHISDGIYIGSYNHYRWSNKVEVTVKEHRIINIQALSFQDGQVSLVTVLTQKILDK